MNKTTPEFKLDPTDLVLKDWQAAETIAIRQIKEAKQQRIMAEDLYTKARQMIMHLGGETEEERINRVKDETQQVNSTKE